MTLIELIESDPIGILISKDGSSYQAFYGNKSRVIEDVYFTKEIYDEYKRILDICNDYENCERQENKYCDRRDFFNIKMKEIYTIKR